MTFRLPKDIRLTPQAQYEYQQKKFSMFRAEIEKQFFYNGAINLSYERNIVSKINTFLVGMRYNFSFAQTAFSVRQSNRSSIISQTASGGLAYNSVARNLMTNNQKNVGRGGLIIVPFLDYNCNGKRDKGEPDVPGLIVRVPAGRIDRNNKEAAIRVTGLEAYNKYFIDLDENSFENPSWKIHNKIIAVIADPNNFKLIEVPVFVEGEISGMVYLKEKNIKNGQGRIIVNIYNQNKILVAKTLTESDGYFSYLGLPPGEYTASFDEAQLLKTNMKTENNNIPFTIHSKKEGDIVDGIELILSSNIKTENPN